MILEVLGSGCTKCKILHQSVLDAVARTGIVAEVRKVEDLPDILARGVLSTPALVKDGKVLFAGKVLSPDEIATLLAG